MTEIKHKAKRLVATLLGLMMALVLLAPSAFAADGSASILVTLPEVTDVDMSGITVTPYLVLDQVNDTETDASKKQYEVTEEFKGFFDHVDNVGGEGFTSNLANVFAEAAKTQTTVYLTYNADQKKLVASTAVPSAGTKSIAIPNATSLDATYPEAALLSKITDANDLSTLYSWVEKYIKAKIADGSLTAGTATGVDGNGKAITLSGLNEGYYALLFTGFTDGLSVKQGILIATSATSASPGIQLKYETIPLEKGVKNPEHTTSTVEDFGEETTADVGDVLTYDITTKIPTLANTDNLTVFKLEDTMENQQLTGTMTLTLTKDDTTVEFTADVPDDASKATYFTDGSGNIAKLTITNYGPVQVDPNDPTKKANKQTFTVDFLPKKADDPSAVEDEITAPLTNYQGYDVELTYTAMVTADAVQVNGNDITLNFTNDGNPSSLTDHTDVYTYGIDVQKKFSDGGSQYGSVKFSLYTAAEYTSTKTALTLYGQNGSYKATGTAGSGTTELALNSTTGKLTITGLDEGTYWLVETATADGYTKSEDIKIVLAANSENKAVLDRDGTTAMIGGTGKDLSSITSEANTSISLAQFEVLNQKGFSLPQTGGAGTWMFTIGGILLVAAAGVLFALSRKKDRSK